MALLKAKTPRFSVNASAHYVSDEVNVVIQLYLDRIHQAHTQICPIHVDATYRL